MFLLDLLLFVSVKMVVSEDDVLNIMGGMEHAGGIKLNDHKRKLKNRSESLERNSHFPEWKLRIL